MSIALVNLCIDQMGNALVHSPRLHNDTAAILSEHTCTGCESKMGITDVDNVKFIITNSHTGPLGENKRCKCMSKLKHNKQPKMQSYKW